MPARRFFAMLTEARIIEARQRMDDCDIAAITICTAEYHRQTFDRFKKREKAALGVTDSDLAPRIPRVDPKEQANLMRAVFGVRPGMVINGG